MLYAFCTINQLFPFADYMSKKQVIKNKVIINTFFCWHNKIASVGELSDPSLHLLVSVQYTLYVQLAIIIIIIIIISSLVVVVTAADTTNMGVEESLNGRKDNTSYAYVLLFVPLSR